jgi:hypothetical protein
MYQSRFTAGYASKQRTRNSIIIIYSKAVAMIRMAAIRIIIINQCCFYFGRRRFYLDQGGCTASLAQPTPIKPPPPAHSNQTTAPWHMSASIALSALPDLSAQLPQPPAQPLPLLLSRPGLSIRGPETERSLCVCNKWQLRLCLQETPVFARNTRSTPACLVLRTRRSPAVLRL